jgi:predicted component of anaerobic dehydrogenase
LPCAAKFLTQVEMQSTLPFYRALALLTREILAAMADELEDE